MPRMEDPPYVRLRLLCIKLRGMAFLIENCNDGGVTPNDMSDVRFGIALILDEISGSMKSLSVELDKTDILSTKSQRNKS